MKRNQIYLKNKEVLNVISEVLETLNGPYLEVGPGMGFITKVIKEPYLGIESDRKFEPYLKDRKIIYGNVLELKLEDNYETLISNLPFDNSTRILKHLHFTLPNLKNYLVIIPHHMKLDLENNTKLGIRLRNRFNYKHLMTLKSTDFHPKVDIQADLVLLTRKDLDFKIEALIDSITNTRKMLRNQIPCLKETIFGQKRLTELTTSEIVQLSEDLFLKRNNIL